MTNFVIDPPWPKRKGGLRQVRPNQTRELEYKTMDVVSIFNLLDTDIFPLATCNHNVFLWVIDSFLHEAEYYMTKRGYKLHCRMVWDKTNGVAPAFTVRFTHEYVLWFYKPKLEPIDKNYRGKFKTLFSEKSREHSRKPNILYYMIDCMYPSSVRIDVFSRERRHNWLQYGNEKDKFNA